MNNDRPNELDTGWLLRGLTWGLVAGAIAALFFNPRSGHETRQHITESSQQLREKLEANLKPIDPVAESLAEGKAAAQRRRSELGYN